MILALVAFLALPGPVTIWAACPSNSPTIRTS
jgi:hypothetical protein